MAQVVYIDETGSVGRGGRSQPYLTVVAVLVSEHRVRSLGEAMRKMAVHHLGALPHDFEFHGHEIWNGTGPWAGKRPPELIAAYDEVIDLLQQLDLSVAHSSIDKALLHDRYDGMADMNAYRLALQFLLEKIDLLDTQNKIIVADEAKEQQFRAIEMVADMQQWGTGEVPGRTLNTVIDSLHFVQSCASPGVQMADLVAYVLQRSRRMSEGHPDATVALSRLRDLVTDRTVTWREPWPRQYEWEP
jgi:hypothetical protein